MSDEETLLVIEIEQLKLEIQRLQGRRTTLMNVLAKVQQ